MGERFLFRFQDAPHRSAIFNEEIDERLLTDFRDAPLKNVNGFERRNRRIFQDAPHGKAIFECVKTKRHQTSPTFSRGSTIFE